jgi:hypothetical protein
MTVFVWRLFDGANDKYRWFFLSNVLPRLVNVSSSQTSADLILRVSCPVVVFYSCVLCFRVVLVLYSILSAMIHAVAKLIHCNL